MFENWLALKFVNYKTMDIFTKGVLWDYWKTGSDETEPTNEKFPYLKKEYWNDEDEIAKIFKIETYIFDYESPLCMAFNEFNYLLKVDPELFTYDIERTKNYDDYMNEFNDEFEEPWDEDGVPYEIRDHIYEPFRFKNGRTKWPTCSSNEDGFCNGVELQGMVRIGYMTYFQDHEWYNDLRDKSLKDEALKQKAIYEDS
ncbi:hypothetical protein Tco_0845168 [Tanacetum coccineum]